MKRKQRNLLIAACEIACRYPALTLEDALGDALQLSYLVEDLHLTDKEKEEAVLRTACWFMGADGDLLPHEALHKALSLCALVEEKEKDETPLSVMA